MLESRNFWSSISCFNDYEFTCKCGCGLNNINHEFVEKLNKAREIALIPFSLNSACRCEKYNASKKVKGSKSSSHLKGLAVDIRVISSTDRFKIINSLNSVGFNRIGVYKNFIHVDIDHDKTNNVIWYK